MADAGDAASWMQYMRRGEMSRAWTIADAVIARAETWRDLPPERHLRPVWRGEEVAGRAVLVRCHHGLGDTIQFARYLPRLALRAESVVVAAQPPLIPLLRSVSGAVRLIDVDAADCEDGWEVEIEITELPHLFRDTLETIPAHGPYLSVEPQPGPPRSDLLRVGLVHQAGDWDERRSIPRELLVKVGETACVELIDLQPTSRRISIPAGYGLEEGEANLTEVARLFASLDLVISVDTMAAHLAGALARPIWTLLHAEPDWRWLEGRSDSPWYPTMRLYRQQVPGEWERVLEQVGTDLRKLRTSVGS